jgi:hypothetical protein
MLKYFKNEADYMSGKPPKGVLNFQQIWVEVDFKDIQMKIDLKIKGSKRVFNMRCTSQEQFQLWQRKLRYTINSSIGKLKELTIESYKDDISNKFDFWRFLRIDEKNFLLQAEVGDLLLCRNKKSMGLG